MCTISQSSIQLLYLLFPLLQVAQVVNHQVQVQAKVLAVVVVVVHLRLEVLHSNHLHHPHNKVTLHNLLPLHHPNNNHQVVKLLQVVVKINKTQHHLVVLQILYHHQTQLRLTVQIYQEEQ
jgi:hypothetical protein